LLPANDCADWRCDIGRRQRGRGNLIKKRLKDMVVVLIDQDDLDRSVRERLGGS
jgi:hypothetical protein